MIGDEFSKSPDSLGSHELERPAPNALIFEQHSQHCIITTIA